MLGKISSAFFSMLLAILIVSASIMPACAQVVHEDPASVYPSDDMSIQDQLNLLIGYMQLDIKDISVYLNDKDYANASDSYQYVDYEVNEYQDLLWRMNLSDSVYESIANNINFTRDQLDLFIQNSEMLNNSMAQYNQSISTGNAAGANVSLGRAQTSYEELTTAYDRLRSNTTAIEKLLRDNNIDTASFENSMVNIDNYMIDLSAQYNGPGGPGPAAGTTTANDFTLTIEPTEPSLGDNVTISTRLMGTDQVQLSGSTVNIYFNSVIVGSYTADSEGAGSMAYMIPADSANDVIYAHAEAISKDRNKSRSYSNVVILYIPDKQTDLTLVPDKSTISYGDPEHFTGSLMAVDGMPAPGKNVTIYMNDEQVGYAYTDNNGSYNFTYNVTPDDRAGKSNFFANYESKSRDVFQGSTSAKCPVDVAQKNTSLSISNGSSFYIGDIGRVNGALTTEDNVPVEGARIDVYADGVLMGSNVTDNNGEYDAVIRIPENATVGTHELYTVFQTNGNQSLGNSTADKQYVEFGDSVEALTVSSLPLIVFQGDVLNINGTMQTASGMPIADREFNITASTISIGNMTTDKGGNFNASYLITGNETIGYYTLSIDELSNEGVPPVNRYVGHFILVPYTRLPSLGASALVLIVIIAVAVLIIRSRRVIRAPEQMIVDSITEPAVVPDMPAASVSTGTAEPKEIIVNVKSPAPFATSSIRMPQPEETPLLKQAPERKALPAFNLDNEIMAIKAAIKAGNLEEAMTGIYLASRKIAIIHDVDVPDSMTHKEFYDIITEKYPSLSKALLYILDPYEIAAFAGREATREELNTAVNSLKEFYLNFERGE